MKVQRVRVQMRALERDNQALTNSLRAWRDRVSNAERLQQELKNTLRCSHPALQSLLVPNAGQGIWATLIARLLSSQPNIQHASAPHLELFQHAPCILLAFEQNDDGTEDGMPC